MPLIAVKKSWKTIKERSDRLNGERKAVYGITAQFYIESFL